MFFTAHPPEPLSEGYNLQQLANQAVHMRCRWPFLSCQVQLADLVHSVQAKGPLVVSKDIGCTHTWGLTIKDCTYIETTTIATETHKPHRQNQHAATH